jgi:hypothetical protein
VQGKKSFERLGDGALDLAVGVFGDGVGEEGAEG